jgi:hypothetical protein
MARNFTESASLMTEKAQFPEDLRTFHALRGIVLHVNIAQRKTHTTSNIKVAASREGERDVSTGFFCSPAKTHSSRFNIGARPWGVHPRALEREFN